MLTTQIKIALQQHDAFIKSMLPLVTTFGLKVLGAASALGLAILVGRFLGASSAGIYYTATSVIMFLSFLGSAGLLQVTMREVAAGSQSGSNSYWYSVRKMLFVTAAVTGIIIIALLTGGSDLASRWFKQPELSVYLPWCTLAIAATVLFNFMAEIARGHHGVIAYAAIMFVSVNVIALLLLCLAATGAVGLGESPLEKAVNAYITACVANMAIATLLLVRVVKQRPPSPGHSTPDHTFESPGYGELIKSGWAFLGYGLATQGIQWLAPLILASFRASEEVAIYNSALRVNMLVGFVLVAVASALGPRFAVHYRGGQIDAVRKLYRHALIFSAVAGLPLIAILFTLSYRVMELFGTEFTEGGVALQVLLAGQLVNILSGPAAQVLIAAKREKILYTFSLVNLALCAVMYYFIVPRFGYTGAAAVTSFNLAFLNLCMVVAVWKLLAPRKVPPAVDL